MAQLVNMRQRIKAIETIKKITNAMRLISMSAHNRLKNKQKNLEEYINTINQISNIVKQAAEIKIKDKHQDYSDTNATNYSKLVILISSEKGLAGNFNTQLFKFFKDIKLDTKYKYHYIAVGKFAVSYLKKHSETLALQFSNFNPNNFLEISSEIANYILKNLESYSQVVAYSNKPKSFFVQEPSSTLIFPAKTSSSLKNTNLEYTKDYIWEQNPIELYKKLKELQIKTTLQQILFDSLLSEQSARFLSMDSSTRNAENLLNIMKIEYNKARQATITRELIELTGGFVA